MRNFMSYDRRWLDEPHVGDHVGRVGLGARRDPRDGVDPGARRARRAACSTRSSPALAGEVSLRTAAYAVLGLARLDPDRLDPQARSLLERLVEQLADALRAQRVRRLALVRGRAHATTTRGSRRR